MNKTLKQEVNSMIDENKTIVLLGVAFLIQAIASAISGLFLLQPLLIPGDIVGTMTAISDNVLQMRAGILVEMITAMGIVMLGVLLYRTLKKVNRNVALIAMGLYLIEAAILAASRMPAYSLLQVSQVSVSAGHPEYLRTLAQVNMDAMNIGYDLHMLPFALGATLFYSLIFRSRSLPMVLAVLGIIAAPLALTGSLVTLLGFKVPIIVFIPNLPFELAAGVVLLIRGSRNSSKGKEVQE